MLFSMPFNPQVTILFNFWLAYHSFRVSLKLLCHYLQSWGISSSLFFYVYVHLLIIFTPFAFPISLNITHSCSFLFHVITFLLFVLYHISFFVAFCKIYPWFTTWQPNFNSFYVSFSFYLTVCLSVSHLYLFFTFFPIFSSRTLCLSVWIASARRPATSTIGIEQIGSWTNNFFHYDSVFAPYFTHGTTWGETQQSVMPNKSGCDLPTGSTG